MSTQTTRQMRQRRRTQLLAFGVIAAVLATAGCGLRASTYKTLKAGGSKFVQAAGSTSTQNSDGTTTVTAPDGTTTTVDGSGDVVATPGDPGSGQVVASGPGATTTGGTSAPSATKGATTPGKAGATTAAAAPGAAQPAYETVGINKTAKTISIGLHAPETGASPVPSSAFATGVKLFWEDHKPFGYTVTANIADDTYNPSQAVVVCSQLATSNFLVFGSAGSSQIQACASDQDLIKTHTPYLSAGVTTNGLTGISSYFALSQTYAQQSSGVYQNVVTENAANANKEWVIAATQGANFDDAVNSMAAVLKAKNVPFDIVRTKNSTSQTDAANDANSICGHSPSNTYVVMAPTYWIYMEAAASKQVCNPYWTGPGVTEGENQVAQLICAQDPTVKSSFLSPYPGLDKAPAGFKAESNPAPDTSPNSEDLEMSIYGVEEIIYQAILNVGSIDNLTRDSFISSMAHFKTSNLSVYNDDDFTSGTPPLRRNRGLSHPAAVHGQHQQR